MVTYGYPVGTNLVRPDEHKIQLTLSRSKFVVDGTLDSIFNWMRQHEKTVCEVTEFDNLKKRMDHPHPKPSLRFGHELTTDPSTETPDLVLMFELYELHDEKHRDDHGFKRLTKFFSFGMRGYHGSSKMRLEINARDPNTPSPSPEHINQTLITSIEGENGIRLKKILKSLECNSKLKQNSQPLDRTTFDYE